MTMRVVGLHDHLQGFYTTYTYSTITVHGTSTLDERTLFTVLRIVTVAGCTPSNL